MAAHMFWNPTFKPPTGPPPPRLRSPSPPRSFVEPLSPYKPTPIEPNFNYPALPNPLHFSGNTEATFAATPRARGHSTSYKSGHKRTPSSIDALADAALAASPSYHHHSRNSSASFAVNGYSHAHPPQHAYGANEPPHKRARSEILPSPLVGMQASRPATSYESNIWSHPGQHNSSFNSRVEEAALLLNFQSGGWPSNPPSLPLPPPPAARPHANSFPQDGFHARPIEVSPPTQLSLLPPFNPQDDQQPPSTLPSPTQAFPAKALPPVPENEQKTEDVEMADGQAPAAVNMAGRQKLTPVEDNGSGAESTEVVSGVSDAPKARRGWPKGKPRGPGSRKSLAEKAATKRAASRKKTPESKGSRSKSEGVASDCLDMHHGRRKSLNDKFVFGGNDSPNSVTPPLPRASSVPPDTPMMIRETSQPKPTRRKADVRPDTICAGCQTTRETANSHGELDEWISCNGCKKWFHIDCAGFKKAHVVRDVDKYFCTTCEPEHGKTTYVRKSARAHASVDYAELQRGVLKTSEESVEHHYIQPIKDGTFQFDPETFPRIRPELVTREFFEKSGTFVEPICIPAEWNPRPWACNNSVETGLADAVVQEDDTIPNAFPASFEYDTVPDHGQDKLEMIMPQGLTVRQVTNLVGADTPIDVIDVKTQNSGAKWPLSRWADYYEEDAEENLKAIRNVISLEVSQTRLGRFLQRPKVVRDIDLQDDVWPQEEIDKGKFPKVQFYCLMSVADSYTDFHIDFGGSSVYYHILKGKKTFFFIPPKAKHLKAYEEWNDSPQQNFTFLPSITKECYRVDLSEGDTMLIPSGWIHAVWTPEDSLVIGGNFLNRLSYKNQFKVVEIEKANDTPMKFRYPFFQKIMWYTAIKYLKTDPLPPAVSQLFYEGQRFEREVPIWADFEGEISQNDPRPGADNARYYSQAEIDGLPDLVNYIFRTVMLVMGRVEGVTADRMKRVNASIPKGHGEPLEVAKTFALWVAWKRGNEDPPAWAHPDAVLPTSKDEGQPKKLSEKKLKELERKEAIAAWRIAPDRQSTRVMAKNANAAGAASTNATSDIDNSSPPPAQQPNHQMHDSYYQNQPYAHSQPSSAPPPPTAFMMPAVGAHFMSTPKTSVLGPKRVACDACRKRRIRCKHKDVVMQATPNGGAQLDGANGAVQHHLAPELHDNIT
ncbi:JmjC domain-containing histone demethylation protein 1, partial [Vermiconidia calcicola]